MSHNQAHELYSVLTYTQQRDKNCNDYKLYVSTQAVQGISECNTNDVTYHFEVLDLG